MLRNSVMNRICAHGFGGNDDEKVSQVIKLQKTENLPMNTNTRKRFFVERSLYRCDHGLSETPLWYGPTRI